MNRKLVLILVSAMVLSCGKDKANQQEEVVINPNTFKVEVEGVFKNDDELILFWKDPSIAYFDDKHTIYRGIKGSEMPQKIIFEFKEDDLPNDIRFDVSSKKDQKEIILNYIKIEQQDRFFIIQKENFYDYFRPNNFMILDSLSGKINTKEIEGSYDPILFTKPQIYPKLEAVLMAKF